MRGFFGEALRYLRHALETAESVCLDHDELLYGASYVAFRTGDYAAAERWMEERLELGRARGDAPAIARSLIGLAMVRGDREGARMLYVEAADVARACGDVESVAIVAHNLGGIAFDEDDLETARTHFQQALNLHRELSDARGEASDLLNLSSVALADGDIDGAAAFLVSSLRLASNLGDKEEIYSCVLGSAEVAAQRGAAARAARLLGAADTLREEMGYAVTAPDQKQRERIAAVLDEDDTALASAQLEGGALTLEDAVAYALEEHWDRIS